METPQPSILTNIETASSPMFQYTIYYKVIYTRDFWGTTHIPWEGARTAGQGDMSSLPPPEIGYHGPPVTRACKLNERAADLRWKIINKMGIWNLRGWLPRPREVPSKSLEDVNATLLNPNCDYHQNQWTGIYCSHCNPGNAWLHDKEEKQYTRPLENETWSQDQDKERG